MSSRSGSESGSDRSSRSRSGSPISKHGSAPTPGHSLEQKSPPNSPSEHKKSKKSRSSSVESNKSAASGSQSPNDRKSRSRSVQSSRSGRSSNRSGSGNSKDASQTSRAGSTQSGHRSRSGSEASNKSERSRSGSASSKRSRSGSAGSKRSGSAGSKRSGSAGSRRSRSSGSNRSGSRSGASSRSASAESRKSGKSKSRSRSASERSRSNTPNLEIDEGPAEKRKLSDDDENEEINQAQKKKRVMNSESENEEEKEEVSAAAIFGDDADDISSEEEKDKKVSDKEENGDDDKRQHSEDEHQQKSDNEAQREEDDDDKENEPEPIPETRIDVEIPKISCDLGRDIHFVKLPNFLSVETRPFDSETYEDEIDEEETLDEEGRARLKLKVENTIRWRDVMDDDGNFKKESNARMVRWSDGSYSLHLGSEIFDVYKQPLQGDHNHLFIRQGTGLQGQAVFRTKLSFRPHSTESFTHRKMTLSLADRSQKTSGIKILSQVGVDPEQDRYLRLKKEEEKLRQASRTSKPRTKKDSGRLHNTSRGEEDGSDDEGAISLNAIKNKYKQQAQNKASAAIYSSDEEGSDIEMKSKKQNKVVNIEESEESE